VYEVAPVAERVVGKPAQIVVELEFTVILEVPDWYSAFISHGVKALFQMPMSSSFPGKYP
jgi:hypothetical protein